MIDHLSEYLAVLPGGRLVMKNGGWSKESFEKDATQQFTRLLPMQCRFEDGATLKDLFLILRPQKQVLEEIVGLHCGEFLDEAFEQDLPPEPNSRIELYWRADDSMGIVEGLDFPGLHEIVGSGDAHDEGTSTRCLGFVPTYKFANLPVRLNHNARFYQWKLEPKPHCDALRFKMGFTLFQVIYGIFWELSFFAHPSNRDQRSDEIMGEINERTDESNLD